MRGGWSRIVAAAAGLGAITAAMGLPGTLVGHKGDHAVRVAAPPVVAHTVVPATVFPAPGEHAAPRPATSPHSPSAPVVVVRTPVERPPSTSTPHVAASEPLSAPTPAPAPAPAPAPTPAPAPAPPPPPAPTPAPP